MNRYVLLAAGAASTAAIFFGAWALGPVVAAPVAPPGAAPTDTLSARHGPGAQGSGIRHRPALVLARATAKVLGLAPGAFVADLASGTTPAALAAQKGWSEALLEDKVVALLTARIIRAAAAGHLTEAAAGRLIKRLPRLVERFVSTPLPIKTVIGALLMTDAVAALHLPSARVAADLRNGESLAAVAASEGMSAAALEATLADDVTRLVDQAVASGRLPPARAEVLTQKLKSRLAAFVSRVRHRPAASPPTAATG